MKETDNDTSWVERINNVGSMAHSTGKTMINNVKSLDWYTAFDSTKGILRCFKQDKGMCSSEARIFCNVD